MLSNDTINWYFLVSITTTLNNWYWISQTSLQEDVFQASYGSKFNLYESMQGHGANLMENLQTTLKLREGEIHQLHVRLC